MSRLWVLLPVVLFSAGCAASGTAKPTSDGQLSFKDAEKVQGVALAKRYVEAQGIKPEQAIFRLDEQISSAGGTQPKSRQMIVVVEFNDRGPWRLLVKPDGTVSRADASQDATAEAG
jgi:hypothetical protein